MEDSRDGSADIYYACYCARAQYALDIVLKQTTDLRRQRYLFPVDDPLFRYMSVQSCDSTSRLHTLSGRKLTSNLRLDPRG